MESETVRASTGRDSSRCDECEHFRAAHVPSTGQCLACKVSGGVCGVTVVQAYPEVGDLVAVTDEFWRDSWQEALESGEVEPPPRAVNADPEHGTSTDPNEVLLERARYRKRIRNADAHTDLVRTPLKKTDPENRVTLATLTRRESWTAGAKPRSSSSKGRTRTKPVKFNGIHEVVDAEPSVAHGVKIVDMSPGEREFYDHRPGVATAVLTDLAERIRTGERPAFLNSGNMRCRHLRPTSSRNGFVVYADERVVDILRVFRGSARRALAIYAWEHGADRIREVDLRRFLEVAA
jgi:hypothetical protein